MAKAGSEMLPTSASSCSESAWGFTLAEVTVSRVTGFAFRDNKAHVYKEFGKKMEQRQAAHLVTALSSFFENGACLKSCIFQQRNTAPNIFQQRKSSN